MTATGVGDCDLHLIDQNGHPGVLRCKHVLYVPGVAKNLLSTYCLGKQARGYQIVADATNPEFSAGAAGPPFFSCYGQSRPVFGSASGTEYLMHNYS